MMGPRLKTFSLTVLILLLPAASRAENTARSFPPALTGAWAMPSCDDPSATIMLFGRHFLLSGAGGRFMIRPAIKAEDRGDILRFPYAVKPFDVKAEGADSLLYYSHALARMMKDKAEDPYDRPEYRYLLLRYERCAGTPAGLNPDGAEALHRLDDAAPACADKTGADAACRMALFAALNTDGGGLDRTELIAAWRYTLFLAAATTCGIVYPGDSAAQAPAFADAALTAADRDDNGSLSAEEIVAGWQALKAGEAVNKYMQLAGTLHTFLPAIPARTAPPPPCACAAPAAKAKEPAQTPAP